MKLSVRSNILIIFLLITGFIATVLLTSQYYFSKKIANDTTEKTFKIIAGNIAQKIAQIRHHIQKNIDANVQNPTLYTKIDFDVYNPVLSNFIYLINMDSAISSIYYTIEDKALYELINMKHTTKLHKKFSAPKNTQWAVLIYKNNIMQYAFLDKELKILKKFQSKQDYNIAKRPWYKKAMQSNRLIYTALYHFKQGNKIGFTYAVPLKDNKSVFAIDYTLNELNKLLSSQKFLDKSQIFLFDKEGSIIASSERKNTDKIEQLDNKFLTYLQPQYERKILKYNYQGNYYYAIYKQINKDLFLGVKLDADVLFAPYKQNLLYSFALALFFILLSIPLILYATKIIVKPIYALIKENEKIKKRKFDTIEHIDTNIIEFIELSNSLVTMTHSIDSYEKQQKKLLDSIIQLIAEAVDAKSSYTAGHCKRVPQIANLLLEAAEKSKEGKLKGFYFHKSSQQDTFNMAAWLHDCGKVTTPEYVVDKATKLETIYNRIHEIRMRFEVLWRDAQIEYLEACLSGKDKDEALIFMNNKQKELLDDFAFIAQCNIGNEYMSKADIERIKDIANKKWLRNFDKTLGVSEEELKRYDDKAESLPVQEELLADKLEHIIKREHFDFKSYEQEGFKEDVPKHLYNHGELYNLCIEKGTLTPEERYKINEHVIMSIKMLEKIPFPKELTKVPEYAGQHHERLDGKGYPRKLNEKELSIPSRIMAIADIFEALTAADRPYKKAKTLSEALDIMHNMAKERHIDKTLFELFVKEKIYLTYAKEYLKKEQIDEVNEEKYLS